MTADRSFFLRMVVALVAFASPCLAKTLPAMPATAPSFRQDIIPILTVNGCNSGGCHGKLAGQNGFKLSLRGYAPEMDYESLAREFNGRRIDFAAPRESLLLQKPIGAVPHEGGNKLIVGSFSF